MTTRRHFVTAAAAISAAAPVASVLAQGASPAAPAGTKPAPKTAEFLFVQTSTGMTYDAASRKFTMTDVSPITIFFADRPDRIAGNMRTSRFVPFWSEGTDSFAKNPPNADISILEGKSLTQVIAVLRNPVLKDDTLSYDVEILQGKMPGKGADVSVFIDIIGMPLTPVSVAGVARRTCRRAVIY